ncbi:Alpha/beta knot methyltransferase, partial [Gilbertella persicaria]|uniref:Alpha/beta knot methyltransferase n=1 Tax=Gilbertella persicaria TaxID=101096 RepID=UPI00221F8274
LEHVYGISSVLAALRAKKRTNLDALYYYAIPSTKKKDQSLMSNILELAKETQLKTVSVDKGRLNNLTDNKLHQGVVLSASPRDPIEISSLTGLDLSNTYQALPRINKRGNPNHTNVLPSIQLTAPKRKPFWIALDEVQDPQNLGSILRTAYFFGVDGVLLCSKNSAPISPTVSKVSSGAAELMDIYSTPNLVKFLKESHLNGWEIIGAAGEANPSLTLSQFRYKASEHPLILVLGNEGTGLRTNVKSACNQFVSIPSAQPPSFNGSVDSLNVGVAAGALV